MKIFQYGNSMRYFVISLFTNIQPNLSYPRVFYPNRRKVDLAITQLNII